jgi:hypothetical protein
VERLEERPNEADLLPDAVGLADDDDVMPGEQVDDERDRLLAAAAERVDVAVEVALAEIAIPCGEGCSPARRSPPARATLRPGPAAPTRSVERSPGRYGAVLDPVRPPGRGDHRRIWYSSTKR